MSFADLVELHVIFYGKVQGVGFRWTVVDLAQNLELKGHVKNLKNGSVEALIQGEKKKCEKLIESLQSEHYRGQISKIEKKYSKILVPIEDFKIIRE